MGRERSAAHGTLQQWMAYFLTVFVFNLYLISATNDFSTFDPVCFKNAIFDASLSELLKRFRSIFESLSKARHRHDDDIPGVI